MRRNFKYISQLIFILTITSCSSNVRKLPYPDPYANCFRSKDITLVTISDKEFPLNVDSLFLDNDGNIIRRKRVASEENYSFDELLFLTRFRKSGENPKNYVISYHPTNDKRKMIQKWTALKGFKWELDSSDIDRDESINVELIFDASGRLILEKNSTTGELTKYSYRRSLLESKQVSDSRSSKPIQKTIYLYDQQDCIQEMKSYEGRYLINHLYFSDSGLPDSALYKGSITLKYNYKY